MTNLTVGQNAFFDLSAQDDASVPHNASYSAQISDVSVGYIAKVGAGRIYMVSKTPGTVNVVVSGTSANGTPLPTVTVEYTVTPASTEPQATHFVTSTPSVQANDITTPAETASDTVTGTV